MTAIKTINLNKCRNSVDGQHKHSISTKVMGGVKQKVRECIKCGDFQNYPIGDGWNENESIKKFGF